MMHRIHFLFLAFLLAAIPMAVTQPAQAKKTTPVTITLPASALFQTIQQLLPLPIEQNSRQFQGTITLDSVSKLAIHDNLVSVQGMVSGKNMRVTTNIGGQDIQLKLGKLVLPVTCDITLRYDRKTQTLFLRPRFQNPEHGQSNSAKTLLPLLNGLGKKEYPVKLGNISPFQTRIGTRTVSVQMEPVDIKAVKNAMILKLRPVVGKSR